MFFETKILFLTCILAVVLISPTEQAPTLVGGPRELHGEDLRKAENDLKVSLSKLAAGEEGPYYEIGKLHSATTQVVSGSKNVYKADLVNSKGESKACTITMWSQPWLPNGIEVTFECDGEDKLVRKHSA